MNKISTRIENSFKKAKAEKGYGFVAYLMASDGGVQTSKKIVNLLPELGVDVIELGLAFSDPMAEGKTIQLASKRVLDNGYKIAQAFEIAKDFRTNNATTPIIFMGYYNPILNYGLEEFCKKSADIGVDGLIIVDLPLEEEGEILPFIKKYQLHFIKLITPATSIERAKLILKSASGFVYYVSVKGITGTKAPELHEVKAKVLKLKKLTNLPIVVGFGIKEKSQVEEIKTFADGVVVGSSIVKLFEENKDEASLIRSLKNFFQNKLM